MMKFDDKKFIAQQIKIHRKKAGYTQEQLAEIVNLSTQHISRIESGCYIPSLNSFFMIVNALKIDLKIFGFNLNLTSNKMRDVVIQKISSATDAELIFYENLIEATKDLDLLHNRKKWKALQEKFIAFSDGVTDRITDYDPDWFLTWNPSPPKEDEDFDEVED